MHYNENSKTNIPGMKLCDLVPTFYIHESVSIFPPSVRKHNTAK
jgi:hypothetical protein